MTGSDGKSTTKSIPYLSQSEFDQVMQQVQASVLSVTGQGGNGSQIHGDMSLNGHSISDVANSDPPAASEAISYSTAQSKYQALRQSIGTQTSDYKATSSDGTIQADASAGAVTITLPMPDNVKSMIFVVIKVDSSGNAVTVVSANTAKNLPATINGAASQTLAAQWNKGLYQSTGTGYIIVG